VRAVVGESLASNAATLVFRVQLDRDMPDLAM
jgi:hypothetical protein